MLRPKKRVKSIFFIVNRVCLPAEALAKEGRIFAVAFYSLRLLRAEIKASAEKFVGGKFVI